MFLSELLVKMKLTVPKSRDLKYVVILQWVFIAYSLMTLIWSYQVEGSFRYWFLFSINYLIVLYVSCSLNSEKKISTFYRVFVCLYIVQVFIGCLEMTLGWHMPNYRGYVSSFDYSDMFVPAGTFYNENNYASVVSLGFGLLLPFSLKRKGGYKLVGLITLVASIIIIVKTGSRTNQISVLLSLLVYFYYSYIYGCSKTFRNIYNFLIVFCVISALLLNSSIIVNEFESTFLSDSADAVRYHLALIAIESLVQSDFFGTGPGGFEQVCLQTFNLDTNDICQPHNWLLELGANFGVIAMLLQLIVYYFLFASCTRLLVKIDSNRNEYLILMGLICSLPSAILSGVSISSIVAFPVVWLYFGFYIATISKFTRGY